MAGAQFEDQVAIVTGAAGGIGSAVARFMAVNVRGVFLGLREVLRVLERQGTRTGPM